MVSLIAGRNHSHGEWFRPSVRVLAVACLALSLAGCRADAQPAPAQAAPPAAGPVAPAPAAPGCAAPSTRYEEQCRVVSVSGKTFRYLVFRADPPASEAMIFDNGGPGASPLSNISIGYDQVAADAASRGLNLIVVDEPWVVAPDDPACRTAMTAFHRDAVRRYPRPAAGETVTALNRTCLTGTAAAVSAADYVAAVEAIEKAEQIRVVRLEGYSFASVRAAYLGAKRPDLVAAVGSPFPVGAEAASFYTAQARSAPKAKGTGWVADSAAAYYTITGTPPADMDEQTAARGLWQVTTDGDMSMSRLGYYAELCGALTGWDDLTGVAHRSGSALTALASVHSPCAAGPPSAPMKLPAKTCFAVLANDPNSPWVPSPVTRGARVSTTPRGQHGKVRIPACQ